MSFPVLSSVFLASKKRYLRPFYAVLSIAIAFSLMPNYCAAEAEFRWGLTSARRMATMCDTLTENHDQHKKNTITMSKNYSKVNA